MLLTATTLLIGTVEFWILSCVVITILGGNVKHNYAACALFLGGLAMLMAAILGWRSDINWIAPAPIYLVVAPLTCRLDALSSIFVGLLAVVTISISLFSPGYLKHLNTKINAGCYWVQLFLFVIGMLGLILASNALSFLIFWELTALTSVLLIATNLSSHESRKAAFIYLGATRIATALLMAGFLWMYALFNTWTFAGWHFSTAATFIPAFIILIGLFIKAGIWPFHEWLPYAHPAAPAPVSALMSGVMIKISLYAIIRLLVSNGLNSPFLMYFMLALGLISAVWGMLFALMQHDLKSLLAYSSIENVGLILIGISLSLIGQSLNLGLVAVLSLAAAIFHCVNHGLFKCLLFLSAGTIDSRVHTRNLEQLGGLGKKMPWTMLFFVIGSAAICALPPLNGFNSKWLIYQSFFHLAFQSGSLWLAGIGIACIAVLGLVSGMALYCFTKAIGFSFLGRPHCAAADHAREGSTLMLIAQALLAICCILLGLAAPLVLKILQPICNLSLHCRTDISTCYNIPMGVFAFVLATLTLLFYRIWLVAGQKGGIKKYITWECGYGSLGKRMQGTATSFAENVAYTFAPLFQYNCKTVITGKDRRHFPESITEEVSMTSILETRLYIPAVRFIGYLGRAMAWLQAGSIHLYLGYILLTLIALMSIGILI